MYYVLMLIVSLVKFNQDNHTLVLCIMCLCIPLFMYSVLMLKVALVKSDQVTLTHTHTTKID